MTKNLVLRSRGTERTLVPQSNIDVFVYVRQRDQEEQTSNCRTPE